MIEIPVLPLFFNERSQMYQLKHCPTVLVIGNGISRSHLNIHDLGSQYSTVGCNALARSFHPSILVTADPPMTAEIHSLNPSYNGLHVFKTKPNQAWTVQYKGKLEKSLDLPGWASGGAALYSACYYFSPREVVVVGFDLDWTATGKFNNIYAGTSNYKDVNTQCVGANNFIKQFRVVAGRFPHISFVRMIPETSAINESLMKISNISQCLYEMNSCSIPFEKFTA